VGLKPTWGRVSRYGLVAFASSCDTVGVLARDVADAASVYAVIAGPDPRDATCAHRAVGEPGSAVARGARGAVVGVPRALIAAHAEPAVARDLDDVLADLARGGVAVREVSLPAAEDALAAYTVLAAAEAASNLARFDGALYGRRGGGDDYAAMVRATRGTGFGREVRRRILLGTHVLTGDDEDRTLLRARAVRERLRAAFAAVFATVDALVLPTAPEPAVLLGSRLDDPVAMYRSDVFTVPASLAGLPALTVPTTCTAAGLPLSVQFVGPAWGEETVLGLGAAVERERRFRARREAPWHRDA
jgi:aspartyl-tRNA(Asn)/glutamyl-tRNA(Gln) amidotransferase subunit A